MQPTNTPAGASPEGKPIITQFQHDWEVHNAGLQAMDDAKAQGGDPHAAADVLDGVTGLTVEGVRFPGMNAALVLALPQLNLLITKSQLLQDEAAQQASMALALYDIDAFWQLVRGADVTKLEEAVFVFMRKFSLRGLKQINGWINAEYAALRGEAEEKEVGKPETASPVARPTEF